MKPKQFEILGEGPQIQPVSASKQAGFYVQFPEETLQEAIAAHDDDPFESLEECKEFVAEAENVGRTFNVVDSTGKIFGTFILTYDGVEELDVDNFRGR